ncbi:MAG: aldehyde dehydrogenase family protein, partial [Acidimicrobiales bacterium]
MRIEHYVDGERRSLSGGRTAPVYLPADGSVQHEVTLGSANDVRLVVDAAAKVAPEWAESSLAQRTKILFRYKELLEAHADELAGIISAEHGKVRSDAMGELRRGIDVVDFACGISHLQKGEFSENV